MPNKRNNIAATPNFVAAGSSLMLNFTRRARALDPRRRMQLELDTFSSPVWAQPSRPQRALQLLARYSTQVSSALVVVVVVAVAHQHRNIRTRCYDYCLCRARCLKFSGKSDPKCPRTPDSQPRWRCLCCRARTPADLEQALSARARRHSARPGGRQRRRCGIQSAPSRGRRLHRRGTAPLRAAHSDSASAQ